MSIDNSPENLRNFGLAALGGVVFHLIGMVLILPLFRKTEKSKAGLYRYASMYGNCGYMALPLANAVLAELNQ